MSVAESEVISSEATRSRIADYPASSMRFDWIAALISCWLVGGLFLDGWAHNHGRVDDVFFTPWHAFLYTGAAVMMGFLAVTQWRNVTKGYGWWWALPRGYLLSLVGALLFGIGGALDLIWHTVFGIEVNIETLLSPSHLLLATAGVLMITGTIRSAWAQHAAGQRFGWRKLGPAVLCAALLLSIFSFFTNYANLFTRVNAVFAQASAIDTGQYAELYLMNADGTAQTRVSYQPGLTGWVGDWSPDGNQVVVTLGNISTFNTDQVNSSLFIMNTDGSNARQLTDMASTEYVPSWSPDGTRIVFLNHTNAGEQIIYIINVDGSNLTALTDNTSLAYMPVWSPDGEQILFTSNRSGVDYIYVMNADGSDVRQVVTEGAYNWGARWSPDGSQIVFNSYRENNVDIYVINADGTGETRLTTGPTVELTPSWSPDGDHILFAAELNDVTDIYRINVDGSGLVNLSNNPTLRNSFPVWSPDGSRILYTVNAYSSQVSRYDRESTGVSSVLVQAALMAGLVMLLVNRWQLPFGALTLIFGLNAMLMTVLNDQYALVLPAVIAGLVGDFLLLSIKPSARRSVGYYGFAFVFPVVYCALFFGTVQLTRGIDWSAHLWLGSIVIAGIIGLLIAILLESVRAKTAAAPSLPSS